MIYEYSGYLKTLLPAPDWAIRDSLKSIVFTADDIVRWSFQDLPTEPEWQHVPVNARRTESGVRLEGRFNDIRQIDNLAADDPSFWVPLSSLDPSGREPDARFPIDLDAYPIVELTYRCSSPNARPSWLWTYPGGVSFDGLSPTHEWRTIVRRVQHFNFPARIEAIIFRLYSISRTVEAFEIESIRFREMSPAEAGACRRNEIDLENEAPVKKYPILDQFMPFGTFMDAGSSKRLAAMLGISFQEYWNLVIEDIAQHHHNTIALERIDRLTSEEWNEILALAEEYNIKFAAIYDLPAGSPPGYSQDFIDTHIQPHASSSTILSWSLMDEPSESAFHNMMQLRPLVEQADPNHPLAVLMRDPDAFPLFARYFPVTGITQYGSHFPWGAGELVRAHLPLTRGQQFWFTAPGFIYATDTPEWHTCPEMRLMLNLAFANGARGWFTFSYHNDPIWVRGSSQRSLTGPFLTFSDLWSELSQRVEHVNALAPLLLKAAPQQEIEDWFLANSVAHANSQLPGGIPPSNIYRLRGDDFELYCIVSNDIREMTTVHIDISNGMLKGRNLYDLSDYIATRQWKKMAPCRHLEMFPSQLRVILVADHSVCEHWHRVIAGRMIVSDSRQLAFDLSLARTYGLSGSAVEDLMIDLDEDVAPEMIQQTRQARDTMLNTIYAHPTFAESRTQLVEASAVICACDGSLCRLLGRGKIENARQLGFKVIPLARELTHLRIELRQGKGGEIMRHCRDLTRRALDILSEIRAAS